MAETVGVTIPRLDDAGGQLVVQPNPVPKGWFPLYQGKDDNGALGNGNPLELVYTAQNGDKEQSFSFKDPVFLDKIMLEYDPTTWLFADKLTCSIEIPATSVIVNGSNAGNCNIQNVPGIGNIVIPAPLLNGTHDYSNPVPVKSPPEIGFFDILDLKTGVVSESTTPGQAKWHLVDAAITAYFVIDMPLNRPVGELLLDIQGALHYLHPTWSIKMKINKTVVGTSRCGGWFLLYRPSNTA